MWAGRIVFVVVLLFSVACLSLAAFVFVTFPTIEGPERYLGLGIGPLMLYMGCSLLAALIWPAKPDDPNVVIEVPPLDQVHGRTSYRDDSAKWPAVMLVIGVIFLAATLGAAAEQPILLVFAAIAVGILIGAGVMIRNRIRYGGATLELGAPARRGDIMRGAIVVSGPGWIEGGRTVSATVELTAIRTFRRTSNSVTVARSTVDADPTRNGDDLTFRFTIPIPLIDTSKGRFSWNIQLETRTPDHRATFLIDVA